jgi:hypothetical protein
MKRKTIPICVIALGAVLLLCSVAMAFMLIRVLPRILETPNMWSADQVFGRLSPFGFQGFYGARRGRRGREGSGALHEVEGRGWSEARLASYRSTSLTADQADALVDLVEAYAFGIFPGASIVILGASIGWLKAARNDGANARGTVHVTNGQT